MRPYILYILIIIMQLSCINSTKTKEKKNVKKNAEKLTPHLKDIVFNGDLKFIKQSEVESFNDSITFIKGDVDIYGKNNGHIYSDIMNLNGLKNIRVIDGNLTITAVNGLNNLEKVTGDIYMYIDEGLNSLEESGSLYYSGNNPSRVLKKIKTCKKLYISDLEKIDSIAFLNLEKIETDITFEFSPNLKYINLPKLKEVSGYFAINENSSFVEINIPNIEKINTLFIWLEDDDWKKYCYISKYVKNKNIGTLDIRGTLLNITKEDFITNCK